MKTPQQTNPQPGDKVTIKNKTKKKIMYIVI